MHQNRRDWLISAATWVTACFLSTDSKATLAKGDPNAPTLDVKTKHKPSDSMWKEHAARTVAMLSGVAQEPALDRWGGRTDRKTEATGFFHVRKINERWWFVDPDGGLFIHVGVVSLSPGGSAASQTLLTRKFSTREKWAEETTRLLRALGFNGAGAWSDTKTLRSIQSSEPLIYTIMGNGSAASGGFMSNFGKRLKVTHAGVGHTAYQGDCLPIFHPEFATFCDEYARRLAVNVTDPYLLGYFSDNELPIPWLDNYLKLSPDDSAMGSSYHAAQVWLDARKGKFGTTIADIGEADRDAWVEYAYDRYLSLTTTATRKYDPHHLCLGPRFYGKEKHYQGMWRAAGRNLDAVAINHYGVWDPDDGVVQYAQWSGKPVIVSEFYAKGADSGFANTGGAGWLVPTQADRGLFYETFALGLLQSRACIGWHWFKYQDNDPTDTKADASNVDSNKGIVDSKYAPYSAMVDKMRELNTKVYAIADYFDRK